MSASGNNNSDKRNSLIYSVGTSNFSAACLAPTSAAQELFIPEFLPTQKKEQGGTVV